MQQTSNTFIQLIPTEMESKKQIYSYDWFSHNIPNWKKWLRKFRNKNNLSFLELGCYEGLATKWLLDNILTGLNCRMTVVDTFSGSIEHQKLDNSKMFANFKNNVENDKRVNIFPVTTKEFLKKSKESFDFIYVDASHKSKDVISDAVLSWDILKKNGILIFDDYEWKKFPETSNLHPKPAIDSFMEIFQGEYKLTGKAYQICLTKKVGINNARRKN